MIVVAGTWELGWNSPIKEIELWKYPLRDFGVDHLAMWPVSGIRDSFLKEYATFDDLVSSYDLPIIFVDEKGDYELKTYEHPEDGLYILGKATHSPMNDMGDSVYIPTIENRGLLWPHQAISIVLYDRLMKQWR